MTAANGKKGTYLLDPADITIYGNVDPAFQSTDGSIDLATPLTLWLDASDINGDESAVVDGSQVSTWYDKSGKGNDAVANGGDEATYDEDGFNGLDGVLFDGSKWYTLPVALVDKNTGSIVNLGY